MQPVWSRPSSFESVSLPDRSGFQTVHRRKRRSRPPCPGRGNERAQAKTERTKRAELIGASLETGKPQSPYFRGFSLVGNLFLWVLRSKGAFLVVLNTARLHLAEIWNPKQRHPRDSLDMKAGGNLLGRDKADARQPTRTRAAARRQPASPTGFPAPRRCCPPRWLSARPRHRTCAWDAANA